jgi:hypothetical protein
MLTILEHPSAAYKPRTIRNAALADVTVAFAMDFTTAGEKLTKEAAGDSYIAMDPWDLRNHEKLAAFLQVKGGGKPLELNIAGNGIYTMQRFNLRQHGVNLSIYDVLQRAAKRYPIKAIRSGGQTGADLAGAVAGVVMGLPTLVLMPRGFRQRNEAGLDICRTEASVRCQIEMQAAELRTHLHWSSIRVV